MSLNRENIVWQSADGTWSLGFYSVIMPFAPDEDFDEEWDVDYDYDSFEWVSTGWPTEAAALASWRGVNPGSHRSMAYRGHSAECKYFDLLALWCKKPELRVAAEVKEERRLNREHFKKLTAEFEERKRFAGLLVSVGIKGDSAAHTPLGLTTTHTGRLKPKGDWLTIDDVRVFNTKTSKFAPRVHSIHASLPTVWR